MNPDTQDRMPTSGGSVTAPHGDLDPNEDLTGKVLGDFQVRRHLGRGGMGHVYLAEQISLKRDVALKILRKDLAVSLKSLDRFKREATSVARATHANIVQIYAIGECEGHHYMALEYVEGRNLREFLEKKGTTELLVGLSIMRQVSSALQRAGELGITHRDIKPENILINRKGEVKVADFGLVRSLVESEDDPSITKSDATVGTPLYMAPEQIERKQIDPRTDIYSFGVTCYHMFAGHPPFRGSNPFEVTVQHVQNAPQPLEEIRPDLPIELCRIIHKMMAKKPDDRYQTAREIVREVARIRDGVGPGSSGLTSAVFSSALSGVTGTPSTQSLTVTGPPSRWRTRLLLGCVVLALAVGVLVPYLLKRNDAIVPSGDGPPLVEESKALFSPSEREKQLIKLVDENIKADGGVMDVWVGMKYSIELGVLYLKQRKLDQAEKFFNDLMKADKTQYRSLGMLGSGMVLAFRDRHEESNKILLKVLGNRGSKAGAPKGLPKQPKQPAGKQASKTPPRAGQMWSKYVDLQEMIAEALYFNYTNSPQTFPAELNRWRFPPLPGLRKRAPLDPKGVDPPAKRGRDPGDS